MDTNAGFIYVDEEVGVVLHSLYENVYKIERIYRFSYAPKEKDKARQTHLERLRARLQSNAAFFKEIVRTAETMFLENGKLSIDHLFICGPYEHHRVFINSVDMDRRLCKIINKVFYTIRLALPIFVTSKC